MPEDAVTFEVVIALVQGLIAFQSLFFAVFLLSSSSGKRVANTLLACLLVALAWVMANNLLVPNRGLPNLNPALGLLFGPLQYLYTRELTHQRSRLGPRDLLHAVPFLVAVCLWAFAELDIVVFAVSIYFSLGIYLLAIYRLVIRYRRVLGATHSADDAIRLSWMFELLGLALLVMLFDGSHFWIDYGRFETLLPVARLSLFVLLLAMVLRVVVRGLRHPQLFAGLSDEDVELAEVAFAERADPSAEDEELTHVATQIEQYLDAAKPELQPDLTLAELARRAGLQPRQVSRAINTVLGVSFSELINRRRVEVAKQHLAQRPRQTVLEILGAAGFASKSTFNDVFKRYTGETPSQFRRRTRQEGPDS